MARATGQGELFLLLAATLGGLRRQRGKLAAAAELLDGGIEAARLLGNTHALVWTLMGRSSTAQLAAFSIPEVQSSIARHSTVSDADTSTLSLGLASSPLIVMWGVQRSRQRADTVLGVWNPGDGRLG